MSKGKFKFSKGLNYENYGTNSIRLYKVGKQAKGRPLGSPPKAQEEGERRGRKMVLQKYRVSIRLEAFAIHPLDPFNIPEAAKYAIDALVDNWLLEDDGHEHCICIGIQSHKVHDPLDERVEITLEIPDQLKKCQSSDQP